MKGMGSTLSIAALAAAMGIMTAGAASAATTYYIDSTLAGCRDATVPDSDAIAGRSPSTAWCGFTQINRRLLRPGDKVLLARGGKWNQQLTLRFESASRDPESPPVPLIEVAAYGSGAARPVIGYDDSAEYKIGISVRDASDFVLRDVEVDGRATDGKRKLAKGINIDFTDAGHRNIRVEDVYVHHNEFGLNIASHPSTLPLTTTVLKGLKVLRVRGEHNESSVATARYQSNPATPSRGLFIEDAVFSGLSLSDDDGQPSVDGVPIKLVDDKLTLVPDSTPVNVVVSCWGASLSLSHLTDAVVLNSRIDRPGGCYNEGGVIGIFLAYSENVRLINNIILKTQRPVVPTFARPISEPPGTRAYIANPDMGGIDFEAGTTDSSALGNYIGRPAGEGIEVLGLSGHADAPNTGVTLDSNVVIDYGWASNNYAFYAAGSTGGGNTIPTGVLRNNIYDGKFTTPPLNGVSFDQFQKSKNYKIFPSEADPAQTLTDVWFAAKDFTADPNDASAKSEDWKYSYSIDGGTTFQPLTYFSTYDRWMLSDGRDGARIDAWNTVPGKQDLQLSRVWIARKAGAVAIRGYAVIYTGGDGAGVQIVHERAAAGATPTTVFVRRVVSPISSSNPDATPEVSTAVDCLQVAANDKVRFLVDAGESGNNDNDWVSWTPSIAYIGITCN